MTLVTPALVVLVALLHAGFLVLEMFLLERPIGLRTFQNTPERAAVTAVLAKNQALDNGFLVAGLLWGVCLVAQAARPVQRQHRWGSSGLEGGRTPARSTRRRCSSSLRGWGCRPRASERAGRKARRTPRAIGAAGEALPLRAASAARARPAGEAAQRAGVPRVQARLK